MRKINLFCLSNHVKGRLFSFHRTFVLELEAYIFFFIFYRPFSKSQYCSSNQWQPFIVADLLFSLYWLSTVKVTCEPDLMKVHIRSNLLFQGKVYAKDRPKTCFVDIQDSMDFVFPIGLHGNDCATNRRVCFSSRCFSFQILNGGRISMKLLECSVVITSTQTLCWLLCENLLEKTCLWF